MRQLPSIRNVSNMNKIDSFLFHNENPDGGISVYNPETKEYEKLTDEEINLVKKLRFGEFSDSTYNPYPDYIDYFTGEKMKLPINAMPEPKSRFLPSASENRKIMKLVTFVRNCLKNKSVDKTAPITDIWSNKPETLSKNDRVRHLMNWCAPKYQFPSTRESYRPPQEYLFDEEEMNQWNSLSTEEKRGQVFPNVYNYLRHVPSYDLISQNYERCLDLYMAPRKRKLMALIEPEQLLESLPSIEDLQPFPSWESFAIRAHNHCINHISLHKTGEIISTGDSQGTVIIWEHNGVVLHHYTFSSAITSLNWIPLKDVYLLSITFTNFILIFAFDHGNQEAVDKMNHILTSCSSNESSTFKWNLKSKKFNHIQINVIKNVEKLVWHPVGDYFVTIISQNSSQQIVVHQLSKYRSQTLFDKSKPISNVEFHPTKPYLFITTKKHIKVYDLHSQSYIFKLTSGFNLITTSTLHYSGDHVIAGSDDAKICWFDIDHDKKPLRVIKLLKTSLSILTFHSRFPLLAAVGEEPTVTMVHAKTFNDPETRPLIIPLKNLTPHRLDNTQNVTGCTFASITPSLYTIDAGGALRLFE